MWLSILGLKSIHVSQRGPLLFTIMTAYYCCLNSLVTSLSASWLANHRRLACLLNRFIKRKSKKTSKLRVTGLCERNPPVTSAFPSQRANNAENVSIWRRHHEMRLFCVDIPVELWDEMTLLYLGLCGFSFSNSKAKTCDIYILINFSPLLCYSLNLKPRQTLKKTFELPAHELCVGQGSLFDVGLFKSIALRWYFCRTNNAVGVVSDTYIFGNVQKLHLVVGQQVWQVETHFGHKMTLSGNINNKCILICLHWWVMLWIVCISCQARGPFH